MFSIEITSLNDYYDDTTFYKVLFSKNCIKLTLFHFEFILENINSNRYFFHEYINIMILVFIYYIWQF